MPVPTFLIILVLLSLTTLPCVRAGYDPKNTSIIVACIEQTACASCVYYSCAWCSFTNDSATGGACIEATDACPTAVTIHKYFQTCYVSSRTLVIVLSVVLTIVVVSIPLCLILWKKREKLKRIEWRFGERRAFTKMMDSLHKKYGHKDVLLNKREDVENSSKAANKNLTDVLQVKKSSRT